MMWWGHGDWSWGGWLVMSLTMIAFWALVIWAVFAAIRAGTTSRPKRQQAPEDILAERLARGEIDEDEYWRRLDAVRGTRPRDRTRRGEP